MEARFDILRKTLDDILIGVPGDYHVRFQKLQRVMNTLREGKGEIRELAAAAVIANLIGVFSRYTFAIRILNVR